MDLVWAVLCWIVFWERARLQLLIGKIARHCMSFWKTFQFRSWLWLEKLKLIGLVFMSPALAGKKESLVVCSENGLTFDSNFHMIWMDLNQSLVIDATWKPHLSMRSKVTYQSQKSSGSDFLKREILPHLKSLKSDWNQSWVIDATWKPSYVEDIKGQYQGQRSSKVKL